MSADERLVFSQTAEGLFVRALKADMTPALRSELAAIGLDVTKLRPAFPLSVWNQALETAARRLTPDLALEAGVRSLGERTVQGFAATVIGQATFALARLIGPRRTLLRARQNFRSGNNYTEVTITELGPTDFRARFNEVGATRWATQGVLSGGLSFAGGSNVRVEIENSDDAGTTYRVQWG